MKSPSHPIWAIVRLVVLMGSLTGILALTASSFDGTEIKTIIFTFLAAAVGETLTRKVAG